MISLPASVYFIVDDYGRTNCSLWLCYAIGDSIHGLTDKSDTVVELDSDRYFFLLLLPNLREFCMSKRSCSYVIIPVFPWNNNQKTITYLYFFLAKKALASLHICTGSPESSSQYRNIMCLLKSRFVYRFCEQRMLCESAPATKAHLWVVCTFICALYRCVKNTPSAL